MSTVTHQTVKLSRGKHSSPEKGVCVMELASMLAGEPFTDHPRSVCPVIGSFLRAYNDAISDGPRRDLYGYAAKVVGSRSSAYVRQQRIARLTEWSSDMCARRSGLRAWLSRLFLDSPEPADQLGSSVVRSITRHTKQTHAAVLALIDELLELGADERWSICHLERPAPRRKTSEPTGWWDGSLSRPR